MVDLMDLWLPILLAGVAVFIASSVVHMATPMHKHDYRQLPGEDAIRQAMRDQAVQPGMYCLPFCSDMKEMTGEAMQAKYNEGPVGALVVRPNGMPSMGASLGAWFGLNLVLSLFVGYLASLSLPAGAAGMDVFQVTGATAFLAYGFLSVTDSIWKHVPWKNTLRFMADGAIYTLVTAAVFVVLWP